MRCWRIFLCKWTFFTVRSWRCRILVNNQQSEEALVHDTTKSPGQGVVFWSGRGKGRWDGVEEMLRNGGDKYSQCRLQAATGPSLPVPPLSSLAQGLLDTAAPSRQVTAGARQHWATRQTLGDIPRWSEGLHCWPAKALAVVVVSRRGYTSSYREQRTKGKTQITLTSSLLPPTSHTHLTDPGWQAASQ